MHLVSSSTSFANFLGTCLYAPSNKYAHIFDFCRGTAGSGTQQSEIHAGVHEWSGGEWVATVALDDSDKSQGDVLDFETSPNDPLWFSHHANLDRLRYYWQERTGDSLATDEDPCGNYYGGVTVYPQVGNCTVDCVLNRRLKIALYFVNDVPANAEIDFAPIALVFEKGSKYVNKERFKFIFMQSDFTL